MNTRVPQTLILALIAGIAGAQSVTFAHGVTANSLSVTVLDESNVQGPGTVVLQGVEFQAIERTGRTVAQEFDPGAVRPRTLSGIPLLELPGANRLLHYRRNGTVWGYLSVTASGGARVVLERSGVGAFSPFTDRLGLAQDGSFAAVPVSGAPGLHLIRLDGGVFAGSGQPSLTIATTADVEPTSVTISPTHVFFVTEDDRIWSLGRDGLTAATELTPPPMANAEMKDELALTGNGREIAFLYGPRGAQRIYASDAAGPAAVLPAPASDYEEPGYLPEGSGHERLLWNHDGSRLLYVDAAIRDEVYVLDRTTGASVHVTSDVHFQPYIGVSILPSFAAGELTVAIGDPNRMDWFRVSPGGTVSNLTLTGSATQPYIEGTLDPTSMRNFGAALMTLENAPGGPRLRWVDRSTGTNGTLGLGTGSKLSLGMSHGRDPFLVASAPSGFALLAPQSGLPLWVGPSGADMTAPAMDPTGSIHATIATIGTLRFPVLMFRNGASWIGNADPGLEQVVLTANSSALILGSDITHLTTGSRIQRPRLGSTTVILSGAGS